MKKILVASLLMLSGVAMAGIGGGEGTEITEYMIVEFNQELSKSDTTTLDDMIKQFHMKEVVRGKKDIIVSYESNGTSRRKREIKDQYGFWLNLRSIEPRRTHDNGSHCWVYAD